MIHLRMWGLGKYHGGRYESSLHATSWIYRKLSEVDTVYFLTLNSYVDLFGPTLEFDDRSSTLVAGVPAARHAPLLSPPR